MKVIYHCYGGSHSSVVAAALHLKWLDPTRLPDPLDLIHLPYFDKTQDSDFGRIHYMGTDESGHDIYILGKKAWAEVQCHAYGCGRFTGVEHEVMAVNCMSRVNLLMAMGGFISRRLGWTAIGVPFCFSAPEGLLAAFAIW